MGRGRMRVVVAAVGCLCLVLGVGPVGAQVLPNPTEGCSAPGVDDACETWVASYHDAAASPDSSQSPSGVAVSRDGTTVYAAVKTSTGTGFDSKSIWAVLAYDAADGSLLWESKWGDPGRYSFPTAIVAGRNGLVFVSGTTRSTFGDPDGRTTTIAFRADDGALEWRSSYDPTPGVDNARTLSLSPDGRTVYVAGISAGTSNADLDYALLAYDASTGAELFVTRWAGLGTGGSDSPFGLAISPSGAYAYLTGWSDGLGEYNVDYGTVAIHTTGPSMGQIAWDARYDGTRSRTPDQANAIAIDPDGSRVYMTGLTSNSTSGPPFAVDYSYGTVAYDARSGQQLWDARTQWNGTMFNSPNAIAADRSRVFVTGQTKLGPDNNVGTVAYDSATGQQIWADSYGVAEHDLELGKALAVSPRSEGVYVTGISSSSRTKQVFLNQTQSGDQLTIGYDPQSGQRDFVARFNSSGYDYNVGHDAVVSRDGSMLYLSSSLKHNIDFDSNFYDSGVIAYEVGESIPPPPDERPTTTRFTSATSTVVQHTDDATFEAEVTDDTGAPVARAEVMFTIGSGEARSFTAITDDAGIARVTAAITEAPGAHQVSASFAGGNDLSPSGDTHALEVLKEDSALALSVSGNGSHRTLTARLTDADAPSPIEGRDIEFFAGTESIGTARTNEDGTATLQTPPGSRGAKETFEARFSGDGYFLGSTATSSAGPPKPLVR
ncbi:MAG: PQQ-binding-like beta-propeller repeat protein [Actinomycetota bacterium]